MGATLRACKNNANANAKNANANATASPQPRRHHPQPRLPRSNLLVHLGRGGARCVRACVCEWQGAGGRVSPGDPTLASNSTGTSSELHCVRCSAAANTQQTPNKPNRGRRPSALVHQLQHARHTLPPPRLPHPPTPPPTPSTPYRAGPGCRPRPAPSALPQTAHHHRCRCRGWRAPWERDRPTASSRSCCRACRLGPGRMPAVRWLTAVRGDPPESRR